ncbi:hypothetical protein BTO04_00385 [Polaribacter sp. SA4-10]|uniref:hypothetical protein n=1 Tax=Polaribacter sp. SA4-10 TaxID=754397 RepID=UPI000B3D0054|nr:hypothetical protein [Polaribacter sp. SA4-10]ARV05240.1 hypothetical protein BTO04_00385 [Polaribacter sp. SA4-10]
MAINSDQIWSKFYEQITEVVVPNFDKNKQVISIAGTTLNADVINADPGISNSNIFDIGNLLPAASPTYSPGGDLITSYSLFLQNIDLGGDSNPALENQINIAATNLNASQENFSTVQGKAYTQYGTYKTVINPTYAGDFDTWANTNYPTYGAAKSNLNGAMAAYDGLMTQRYGAGYATLQASQAAVSAITGAKSLVASNPYNMGVKVGSVAPAGSVTVLPGQENPVLPTELKSTFRPAYNIGGGLPGTFTSWQTASVAKKFPVSVKLSGNFSSGNYSDFGWSESVQASYRSWFSVKLDQQASYSAVSQNWDQSSFDCEISFNGMQQFPITPDANWFSPGMIQNYKDKLLSTSPQFFGEGGSLNVIPSSVLLGYGLKIKIKIDNASYSSLKTAFQQSASLSVGVGPFNLSVSESSHNYKSEFSYDDNSSTLIIEPENTNIPFLLGVLSNKY